MRTARFVSILSLSLLLGGLAARAADVLIVNPMPGEHPKLRLTLPPGWTGNTTPSPQPGGSPQAVIVTPLSGLPTGEVKMVFVWEEDRKLDDDITLSILLESETKGFTQPKKAEQVKLAGKSGNGLYSVFMAADQVPPPGPDAPPCTTQGLYSTGGWMVDFQIYCNDPKGPEFAQALNFLQEGIAVDAKAEKADETTKARALEVMAGPVKLKLQVPAGWEQTQSEQLADGSDLTFSSLAAAKEPFSLNMSFSPHTDVSQEKLDDMVRQVISVRVPDSIEQKITLVPITSKGPDAVRGSYAVLTYKQPDGVEIAPGQYVCLVSGVYVKKGTAIAFTLMLNNLKGKEYERAMKFILDGVAVETAK